MAKRGRKKGGTKTVGSGRKKGTPNKLTAVARDVIATVASNLGGAERMHAWVREDPQNERIFWSQIYPKLLPVQHEGGDPANPMRAMVEIAFVAPK